MRKLKRKRAYVVGGLALSLAFAASGTAYGQSAVHGLDAAFTPSKAPKLTGGSLHVATPNFAGPAGLPTDTQTNIDFPSEMKLTTKGIPTCDPAQIEGTTTEQAKAACGKAQVGQGSSTVDIGGTDVSATVTAFNGKPSGGNPVILLHSRAEAISSTLVLAGTVVPSPSGGVYGQQLQVPAPPLAGGVGKIENFETTVQKKTKVKKKKKKKKYNYISNVCKDGTWSYQRTSTSNEYGTDTVTFEQPCTK